MLKLGALKVWSCIGGLICGCSTKAKTCQRNSILNVNEFHSMAGFGGGGAALAAAPPNLL